MLPFIEGAAAEFKTAHEGTEPAISEARSGAAVQKLVAREVDFAFMARPVRASEVEDGKKKGIDLHMVAIAAEAVGVIVHPSNPMRNVSSERLREVFFSGKTTDWASLTTGAKVGKIHVFAVNPKTSGTGELFAAMVTGSEKTEYVKGASLVDFSDATVAKVAADPDAISFTGVGNVDASVIATTLDGIAPTEKNILDTSYLLNRKLFVLTGQFEKGATREFVKYLLSDPGQRGARAKGFTPILLD
jgi:phosphate transport system substrate-binding protein